MFRLMIDYDFGSGKGSIGASICALSTGVGSKQV